MIESGNARSALEQLSGPVRDELAAVQERLAVLQDSLPEGDVLRRQSASHLRPATAHLFRAGGKRLRPLLTLLAARAAGPLSGPGREAVIRGAAAVEVLHTASLAHDDMVDGAPERRGARTLHAAFGATVAVLVGDLLYSRFFREVIAIDGAPLALRLRLVDDFLAATEGMCQGEILQDRLKTSHETVSLDAYLQITSAKTAGFLAACCSAGALLNGADDATAARLSAYGHSLGLVFQIADDLEDGDALFTDAAELRRQALFHASAAVEAISMLPGGEASDALIALSAHFLSRAR